LFKSEPSYFNFSVLNPVPFVHTLQYGLSNPNNVLLGLNAAYKITNTILAYGQWMQDDWSKGKNSFSNKSGYQLGILYRNVATIKNLNLKVEYNTMRPFAYQYGEVTQSYSHYNQSLANPLNANFKEFVAIADYNFKNFFINIKIVSAQVGVDSSKFNAGNKVLQSSSINSTNNNYNDIKLLRGNLNNLLVQDFSVGYLINPYNNFMIKAGFFNRVYPNSNVNYVYVSLSAFIMNQYLDF
jgi:hypothetical protein